MDEYDIEQAEKHIQNAWIAGIISAGLTLIFIIIGISNGPFQQKFGIDEWSLFDVAILCGLTYGTYRKKRFAALGLLAYFILGKISIYIDTGNTGGGIFEIAFMYFFFMGIKAAFQLHKHLKETGQIPTRHRKRGFLYYLGISIGGIISLLIIAAMIVGISSPEMRVIPGSQVKQKHLDFVKEEGLLNPSEKIHYWYSDGLFNVKEGLYFFTDEKVVIYTTEWEEPAYLAPYNMIDEIYFYPDSTFLGSGQILLFTVDGSQLSIYVSNEENEDQLFYTKLKEVWNAQK